MIAWTSAAASMIVLGLCVGCSHSESRPPARTEWHLDPSAPRPDAGTRTLRVLVQDIECASGRSQDELITGHRATYEQHEIAMRFEGKNLGGGFQTCPAPRPFWVMRTITLAEPIGERRLIDIGFGKPGQERYPADACPVADPRSLSSGCPVPSGHSFPTQTTF